jgi:hypothetical protein
MKLLKKVLLSVVRGADKCVLEKQGKVSDVSQFEITNLLEITKSAHNLILKVCSNNEI